ncbi:hypothetical protein [Pseudoalteromonas luteoviolacea]|uniref:Uncharacterized protein n=1 Tax=Pseudoalteromonas luteoviolacea NCIMB 1942 TaxID=1365253 RepID=A0A167BYU0_9GAMM|nr:hypothetical protein [Pseudoalteromonas luteoviolacea]KZN47051.1 hypothetical protein N482_02205 [Pseudoalteromonas luteoviolacea NCIMB 1942]
MSHQLELLSVDEIKTCVKEYNALNCDVLAGVILAMRSHLLHASEKLLNSIERSFVHMEFSCYELPQGINWA